MLSHFQEGSANFHETPIKRGKDRQQEEPNTAESEQTPSKAPQSLESIEAKQLFEKFDAIVRVSEEDQFFIDLAEPELERKLDYEESIPTIKLDFEPKSSSMKKKPKKTTNGKENVFRAINLFAVQRNKSSKQESLPLNYECKTPEMKEKVIHPELCRAACKERGLE